MRNFLALLLAGSLLAAGCGSASETVVSGADPEESPSTSTSASTSTSGVAGPETSAPTPSSTTTSQTSSTTTAPQTSSSTTTAPETSTSTTEASSSTGGSGQLEPLNANGDLAVGEARIARGVTTHCGLQVIYLRIAGTFWESSRSLDGVPDEWADSVRRESIDLVVELVDATTLSVTAVGSGASRTYVPIASPPLCD